MRGAFQKNATVRFIFVAFVTSDFFAHKLSSLHAATLYQAQHEKGN